MAQARTGGYTSPTCPGWAKWHRLTLAAWGGPSGTDLDGRLHEDFLAVKWKTATGVNCGCEAEGIPVDLFSGRGVMRL